MVADGIARADQIHETDPVPWPVLERVHDAGLLERIREGGLSVREERGLGLPWSPALVERGRRAVAGTLAAARHALERGVAMNLGGGTHHAGRAFARGYCLFNDVVAALGELRAEGLVERALVVDCDVHQGDGTADLLGPDPHAFTLSLHGARNYPFQRVPSDLDIDLASGTGDADYLEALDGALDVALRRCTPEIAFYLAGADPWEGDRLGRLALTKPGLRARDERVLDRLRGAGIPVCVVLAGGYAEDVRDTVDINAARPPSSRRGKPPNLGTAAPLERYEENHFTALLAILAAALLAPAGVAHDKGKHKGKKLYTTKLKGANEVPGPGDPDGKGKAWIRLTPSATASASRSAPRASSRSPRATSTRVTARLRAPCSSSCSARVGRPPPPRLRRHLAGEDRRDPREPLGLLRERPQRRVPGRRAARPARRKHHYDPRPRRAPAPACWGPGAGRVR